MADPANTSGPIANGTPALTGTEVIRRYQRTLPGQPGVYRMLDHKGLPLYVGKAINLKRRVAAYVSGKGLNNRLQRMVAATASMEFVTTHTEVEALLLESNLIKKLKPRFNILLRDDKSFPYILITGDHDWPQIAKHRGARQREGRYFGPFASAGTVNDTINALQRAFPLRSCSDSVFAARTRPCLQYQIKRCTAPCVGRIDPEDYRVIVDQAGAFLSGKSHSVQEKFSAQMEEASQALDFETAAIYRDRIRALTQIQAQQGVNLPTLGDADVIAAWSQANETCVQVFFFRAGQNYGNRPYFPAHTKGSELGDVLGAFLGQFYAARRPPRQVLLSHAIENHELTEAALSVRAKSKLRLTVPRRGAKRALVLQAQANARFALNRRMAESASQRKLLEGVARTFGLEARPQRIEVYDNSHISGSNPVGAMIVAGPEGLVRSQYRKFNIKSTDSAPGDDYAMVREVLTRRFSRLVKESGESEAGVWPDLVLIDGGSGQLSEARAVFEELGVIGVALAAIAKGSDRNAGRETFHLPGKPSFRIRDGDPVLFFLQRLRDESHRFALESHRGQRSRHIGKSLLDEIPGIGAARKRALLHRFGSARAVAQAGVADLEQVAGISNTIAKVIYRHFHSEG